MIRQISTRDARFPIGHGHGSDAIHKDPVYSYAVTELHDDRGRTGIGLAFTLGEGRHDEVRLAVRHAPHDERGRLDAAAGYPRAGHEEAT